MPKFENAAFNRSVLVSNACGTPPEDYCMQTGSTRLCHRCDAADPEHSHGARLLTDFHTDQEPTWWQSQSIVGSTPVGNLLPSAAMYFNSTLFFQVAKVCILDFTPSVCSVGLHFILWLGLQHVEL
jgi:hypothetical protein